MIKNYLKTAWRNLVKNKAHSFINITGLAVGMAVTILIGLWIWDELSFNKSFPNYNKIASVMQHQTFNGETGTQSSLPYLTGDELRKNYGSDFKYVTMCSWTYDHILTFGEKKITKSGNYFEPEITDMLSLKMLKGTRQALKDIHGVILSASTAKAMFGDADPMNKRLKIDNKFDVTVAGVYQDLPYNSDFLRPYLYCLMEKCTSMPTIGVKKQPTPGAIILSRLIFKWLTMRIWPPFRQK